MVVYGNDHTLYVWHIKKQNNLNNLIKINKTINSNKTKEIKLFKQ